MLDEEVQGNERIINILRFVISCSYFALLSEDWEVQGHELEIWTSKKDSDLSKLPLLSCMEAIHHTWIAIGGDSQG